MHIYAYIATATALAFFYTAAAVLGYAAGNLEPGTFWASVFAASSGWAYKVGHVPTAILCAGPVFWALCGITECKASFTETGRDFLFFAIAAVIFLGLCNAR